MEQNNVATTEDAVLLFDMACGLSFLQVLSQ